jgi:hypothetical protein
MTVSNKPPWCHTTEISTMFAEDTQDANTDVIERWGNDNNHMVFDFSNTSCHE